MSREYSRRGRNWFTAMGVLFIVMAVIVLVRNMILWSPEFALDFLLGPDITNEKVSLGMIVFGCILIGWGYKKQNVKTRLIFEKAKNIKVHKKVSFCVDVGVNAPNIFGVMGQGRAKLLKEKTIVRRIAKKILLRYFKTLEGKSARELLEDTDCIIEITPKKFSNWKY